MSDTTFKGELEQPITAVRELCFLYPGDTLTITYPDRPAKTYLVRGEGAPPPTQQISDAGVGARPAPKPAPWYARAWRALCAHDWGWR